MRNGTLDLLIVGGGITGAGVALDAASRGMLVGLIEKDDFASGTSSKSSKMIHGGLRYLKQLEFGLVKEALRERDMLLHRIAPHLVEPVSFLYPLRHRIWERLYVGSGVFIYDWLAGKRRVPNARHLTRSQTKEIAPALRTDKYVGGIQFWDAQEDDARFVLCVARTAAAYGAKMATRVKAERLLVSEGRVTGVEAKDTESGECFNIRASHVASATGAWTGQLQREVADMTTRVRPSKGVHIVLSKDAITMKTGLIANTERGLLYVIPWQDQWLVGDTDTDWPHDLDSVVSQSSDVDDILLRLNSVLVTPVSQAQISGVFAGLRPLVADASQSDTSKISRAHAIASPAPGLTCICGGKYTTYRKMAADLVDSIIPRMQVLSLRPCKTESLPLLGAQGFTEMFAQQSALAADLGLSKLQVARLLRRYGDCIVDIAAILKSRPELAVPVREGKEHLRAEIVYACSHEGALHIADVLDRRTRLSLQQPVSDTLLQEVAIIMQQELSWSGEETIGEIAKYKVQIARDNQWKFK